MYKIVYQLTDGRKSVGGKLEVKLRIRDPFKSKQVEEVKEKWLVIDQFIKTMTKPLTSKTVSIKSGCFKRCNFLLEFFKEFNNF